MPQIFSPATNTWSKVSLAGLVILLGLAGWLGLEIVRSPYVSQAGVVRDQPVPFSHEHHVSVLGIDCRFCHATAERAASAGLPATEVCMGCHSQIWTESPTLAPVRESFAENKPLRWTRVHDLPDFVYFDHSIHVAKGVACDTCHGKVEEMPLTWREKTLHMEWCLECHRDPHRRLGPRSETYGASLANVDLLQPAAAGAKPREVADDHIVNSVKITNCSTCHR